MEVANTLIGRITAIPIILAILLVILALKAAKKVVKIALFLVAALCVSPFIIAAIL